MKTFIRRLSISQNILAATLTIVFTVLLMTILIFYSTFARRTDALVESQSREINKQIVLNYESYINSVIETSNYIQFASQNLDASRDRQELQNVYSNNLEIKRDMDSISLYDQSGRHILGDTQRFAESTNDKESWFTEALYEESIFHFIISGGEPSDISDSRSILVSRAMEYTELGMRRNGVLLMELNFSAISALAEKTNLGPNGLLLIIDDTDHLVYASPVKSHQLLQQSYDIAIQNYFGGSRTLIDDLVMHMNITPLHQTRWRIVTVNDIDENAQTKRRMLYVLFIIFAVSVLLTTLVAIIISRRISRPLTQLQETMSHIEQGDFTMRADVTGQREIVDLAESFNSMTDKIRSLMERVVAEQRGKRKTELVALQNQINPHFLYNTLDSIVWLAENQRTEDVITTVVALAKFFRISISRGDTFIPVRDEISHIENYLTIQKIRYQDRFTYTLDIDENVYDHTVMKLILQPIVENAIYHGIGDEQELITIRGRLERDLLIFEVENTGYGITDEQIGEIHQILQGTHEIPSVGMRNVYQRLRLYYGDRADIIITSRLDEMTCVRLIMPTQRTLDVMEKGADV